MVGRWADITSACPNDARPLVREDGASMYGCGLDDATGTGKASDEGVHTGEVWAACDASDGGGRDACARRQ